MNFFVWCNDVLAWSRLLKLQDELMREHNDVGATDRNMFDAKLLRLGFLLDEVRNDRHMWSALKQALRGAPHALQNYSSIDVCGGGLARAV